MKPGNPASINIFVFTLHVVNICPTVILCFKLSNIIKPKCYVLSMVDIQVHEGGGNLLIISKKKVI